MVHPPDRFQGIRVGRQAGDEMPVDMRQLIAQQFVIDFPGAKDLCERFGHERDLFHQLNALGRRQVKQFGGVAPEDDDRPAGKELVFVQVGLGQPQVGDEVVGARPGALTGFAGRLGHG